MAVESLERNIATILEAASPSIGTFESSSGWSLRVGKEPQSPDTCIVITRSGGLPPNPKFLLDYPTVQVRVRGSKGQYREAELKAYDVKDKLLGFVSADVGGDRWVSITMLSDIVFIGYDGNERPMFSVNFQMIIEPQTTALSNRQAI